MVRTLGQVDFDSILAVINDGADAYRGIIPADCWQEPYMPADELQAELAAGVAFAGFEIPDEGLIGVMGVQPKGAVTLIRHAYVRRAWQRKGIGGVLLAHLYQTVEPPVLIGTWRAATWAIRFYQDRGFRLVTEADKKRLLARFWTVPARQAAESVVLADQLPPELA